MKTKLYVIMILMTSLSLYSQNVCQQTHIELEEENDAGQSYVYQATTSVKLLPGFRYKPKSNKSMAIEIDRYSVIPPTDGYYGGATPYDDGIVGSLSGDFNVGCSGSAVYDIKLNIPNAIGTMMPNLSIVYNNQTGDGIMGWAWNLSGLSSIERVGQTEYHDGKVTNVNFVDDRFMLDGQRLMLVCGSYGSDKAEYKTEIDNLDKILSYTNNKKGPDSFMVWKSDGTIWEYGMTNDSKLEAQSDNDVIIKWLLCKVSDRNGNYIRFRYDKNVENGESYISSIEYTCNDEVDISPAYKISFVYEHKQSDNLWGYVNGGMIANNKILKNITIQNNYTGKTIYDYSMEYYAPGIYDEYQYIHYRLKSVGLTIGEDKINPTRILWNAKKNHYPGVNNDFRIYQQDKSVFSNVPFVGDFNGDGFSDVLVVPYKIQETYQGSVYGKVYLNNGDGTFQNSPTTTIQFDKNLEWIYVVDINGDGIDDIIPCEIDYDMQNENTTISIYIMKNGSFVKDITYCYDNAVVLSGKFVSGNNRGVVVMETFDGSSDTKKVDYIHYEDDKLVRRTIYNNHNLNGKIANYVVMDMSGDGLSEILAMYEDGYKVYSFSQDKNLKLDIFTQGSELTKDAYLFPNDFNGDGKTDILYYHPSKHWNFMFSKGCSFTTSMFCSNNYILDNVVLQPKDRYRCSLRELQSPAVTIRTADFDGDGTADVGVFKNMAGNYYLTVGFKPFMKPEMRCGFSKEKRYYMPINYSHQTIHIGCFLAQENISILSSVPRNPLNSQQANIVSLHSHSVYYNVERIIDGMGNVRGFSYDYLMHKANDDTFYTCSHDIVNDVRRNSIPISAIKSDTTFNVNNKPVVTKYEYHNAMIHTKGRGFIGFEKMVTRNYVGGCLFQKQEQEFEMETMGAHCILVPSMVKLYQGENVLLRKRVMSFGKYVCTSNDKVVTPIKIYDYEYFYNPDRKDEVLKLSVTRNDYLSDVDKTEGKYKNVVQLKGIVTGLTSNTMLLEPENCDFVKDEQFVYKDDINEWIINRPVKTSTSFRSENDDEVGSSVLYTYDDKYPLRMLKEVKCPNVSSDLSDPLSVVSEFEYDRVGNIISHKQSSQSSDYNKLKKYEYAEKYKYRYVTKTIDELGREIISKYDEDYGVLVSTVDYNGFETINENDPAGLTDVVRLPDGTKHSMAIRWSKGNDYSPVGAAYYKWEKSTGNSESIVFYHKSGIELRTLTYDVSGKAIIIDKIYDDYGNIKQKSLPYYYGDNIPLITNVYDEFNRLVETTFSDGLKKMIHYDGNDVFVEYISVEGKKKRKRNTYNVMGLITSVEDYGGNIIEYQYSSDGLMKSSKINNNLNSEIFVTYDNCRNKKTLYDPNYGLISYEHDAFGNVKKIVDAKSNVVEFKYDELGRMLERVENDVSLKKKNVVQWTYDEEKGKIGLLKRISTSDNHHISYVYDDKLKLLSTTEMIHGKEYVSSYTYDDAGRVSTITYPSGLSLTKIYSNSGFEKEIYDNEDNKLLWRTIKTNASGYVTDCQLGNGVKTQVTYNKSFLIENIYTYNDKMQLQNLCNEYDGFGNLLRRSKLTGQEVKEDFEYDSFDRLVSVSLNGEKTGSMIYDNLGNIRRKNINDVDVFYDASYDKKKPNAIVSAKTKAEDIVPGFKQTVRYSQFNNVIEVVEENKVLSIEYGSNHNRVFMKSQLDGSIKNKTYVGNCEYVDENGDTRIFTFIDGPNGVFAVCVFDENGDKSYNYVHKDHLGSWNVITDDAAELVREYSFDAWGNMRNPNDWTCDGEFDTSLLFDRGFTGHEHITDFGLINMNGRVYDPMMSMMLSPDNNIQMPQASQNFNRYSYCLNNPLKYNDPTGEWVESVVMGVVGGAVNVLFNADKIDSFGEGVLLFGVGFAKGFLTEYTMGESWFVQVGVRTFMEGVSSGINVMVGIGDGSFKFSGDDWNSIKEATYYGFGNGLVNAFMHSYLEEPTDTQYGDSFFNGYRNKEFAHAVTSLIAHGMGCWFSGQPLLQTMELKDFGLDMKMLGYISKRLLASSIRKTSFPQHVLTHRAFDISDSAMTDVWDEEPDSPPLEFTTTLVDVFIEDSRIYVIGNIFEYFSGEMFGPVPKPYFDEVITFPFNFSMLRSIFSYF